MLSALSLKGKGKLAGALTLAEALSNLLYFLDFHLRHLLFEQFFLRLKSLSLAKLAGGGDGRCLTDKRHGVVKLGPHVNMGIVDLLLNRTPFRGAFSGELRDNPYLFCSHSAIS